MKGLRFRLFNTQPGHKAAMKEEERSRYGAETGERGGAKGIGLRVQKDTEREVVHADVET